MTRPSPVQVSLATSPHLAHGRMTLDHRPGDPIPMQSFVPVGLLALKSYAEASGVDADVRVVEVNGLVERGVVPSDERFYDALADQVHADGDALVGLMTDADSLHHTVALARQVKRRDQGVRVCLGGPAASPLDRRLLEAFPWLDFVVRGEGEVTFASLLECLDLGKPLDDVLGLTWRAPDGTAVANPERPVLDDLDALPFLVPEAVGLTDDAALYLDVGRGCPFQCAFCSTAPFWKRRFRMKSAERIVEEMRQQHDAYGRTHVNFSHDIFTCDRPWTSEFCARLADSGVPVTWSCSTRTDVIDEQLLGEMAAAGCDEIYFGIETGSAEMQRVIAKNLDLERSREIVVAAAEVGIRPVTGFIVGYPMETEQTFTATLDRFFDFLGAGRGRAHLFPLCPFAEAPMAGQHHPIGRVAATFDLPLPAAARALTNAVRADGREALFASLHRFLTPGLSPELVDACEEISSRLVDLKSLWPVLLPHYDSSLDWLRRWIDWIKARNAVTRPGTSMPCHGEVDDLLDFVDEELVRLGLTGAPVAELVRYERRKLDAVRLLSNDWSPRRGAAASVPSSDAMVARGCDLLLDHFGADIGALLAGDARSGSTWVVYVKRPDREIDTIRVGARHAAVLERAHQPRRMRDVLPDDAVADLATDLRAVADLLAYDLLVDLNVADVAERQGEPAGR